MTNTNAVLTDHLANALEFALLIERVHGSGHPELTRVRELTQELASSADAAAISDLFRELRSVTSGYTVPSDGCEAYTATYDALRAADGAHRNA